MIKPLVKVSKIKKIKKPKAKSKAYYQRKADTLMQELGRNVYKDCLVCGKPMSCLHHYFPKSSAIHLRYDWFNLIPLCNGCHFRHHQGDPRIQNAINKIKGTEWLEDLNYKKKVSLEKSNTIQWYKNVIEILKIS
jgi:5-methylcytosine-specific restriction endonuclease McrA